jgi:hypothetical protein
MANKHQKKWKIWTHNASVCWMIGMVHWLRMWERFGFWQVNIWIFWNNVKDVFWSRWKNNQAESSSHVAESSRIKQVIYGFLKGFSRFFSIFSVIWEFFNCFLRVFFAVFSSWCHLRETSSNFLESSSHLAVI